MDHGPLDTTWALFRQLVTRTFENPGPGPVLALRLINDPTLIKLCNDSTAETLRVAAGLEIDTYIRPTQEGE